MCPEAFCGGNIGLIQNGDIVTIDPVNKTLDVVCSCVLQMYCIYLPCM